MYIMDHNIDNPLQLSTRDHVRHFKFMRSMHGHGQLPRSWNEALSLGFGDLDEPEHDYVVLLQGDVALQPTWWTTIQPYMSLDYNPNSPIGLDVPNGIDGGCHFTQFGRGDELLVFTPTAVKNIGMFDERYTGIVWHEFDYFQRARNCMPKGTCLHDHHGMGMRRVYRPVEGEEKFMEIQDAVLRLVENGNDRGGAERLSAGDAPGYSYLMHKFPGSKHSWVTGETPGKCCSTGQAKMYTPFENAVNQHAYDDC